MVVRVVGGRAAAYLRQLQRHPSGSIERVGDAREPIAAVRLRRHGDPPSKGADEDIEEVAAVYQHAGPCMGKRRRR